MVYINKGDHDNPHGLPKDNLEGFLYTVHHDYTHTDIPPCTHTYDHISQLDSLANSTLQQTLYTNEADASLFTTDTATPCAFNIIPSDLDTESPNDVHDHSHNNTCIHFYSKH